MISVKGKTPRELDRFPSMQYCIVEGRMKLKLQESSGSRRERFLKLLFIVFIMYSLIYRTETYWYEYQVNKLEWKIDCARLSFVLWKINRSIARDEKREITMRCWAWRMPVYLGYGGIKYCKVRDDPALLSRSMSFPPLRKCYLDCSRQPYWPSPIYKH